MERAFDYQTEIERRFNALADGAQSGVTAHDIAPGLRRLVSGSHAICFRAEGDVLRVVRVLHASRHAGRWV